MDITFISSLDAEEEERLAPALLTALSALLDGSSLAYTIRIRTTGLKVFSHSHPTFRGAAAEAAAHVAPRERGAASSD